MKVQRSKLLLSVAVCSALTLTTAAQARKGPRGGPPRGTAAPQGVYSTVSGTISQLNYDREAEVDGFLLNDRTLVHLGGRAASRIGTAVKAGDTVQIGGLAETSPAGLQTIEAQSVQDRTSGKSFAVPAPGAAAPYSGSGRIRQMNYGRDGAINGFLLDGGTLATVPAFSAQNPSSIRVGSTVSYTGYARNTISGHTVVDLQTISVNGQALALGMEGRGRGPGAPPPSPAAGLAPDAPPPPPAANNPAPPAGRADQPPPPPPPAQD